MRQKPNPGFLYEAFQAGKFSLSWPLEHLEQQGFVKGTLLVVQEVLPVLQFRGLASLWTPNHSTKRNLISPRIFFFLLWSSVFTRISANPLEVSLPWKCQCLLVPWSSFLLSCSLIHYNTKPEASAPLLYLLLSSGGCTKGQWTNICCLTFSKTKAMSIDWEESWRKAGIHTGRRGKGWVQRKINQAFRGELWAGAVCASVRNWSSFRFTLHWALLWFQLS